MQTNNTHLLKLKEALRLTRKVNTPVKGSEHERTQQLIQQFCDYVIELIEDEEQLNSIDEMLGHSINVFHPWRSGLCLIDVPSNFGGEKIAINLEPEFPSAIGDLPYQRIVQMRLPDAKCFAEQFNQKFKEQPNGTNQ